MGAEVHLEGVVLPERKGEVGVPGDMDGLAVMAYTPTTFPLGPIVLAVLPGRDHPKGHPLRELKRTDNISAGSAAKCL